MSGLGRRGWLKALLIAAVFVLIGGTYLNYLYLADLRPATLEDDSPHTRARAAKQLEALAEAHGADVWRGYQVMEAAFEDTWHGALTKRLFMHWKESPQKLRGRFIRGEWTSELELLSGPDQGNRWGIQSWKTWTAHPGEEAVFAPDETIEFVLPTTHYFIELPLRMRSATIAINAGQAAWGGETYDLVFTTRDSVEPIPEVDQYLLWIDPQTGLLARADFTVRDQGGGVVSSAHYRNYRDFGGVKIATTIALHRVMPGGTEIPVHTMTIDSVQWDTVSPNALRPDPTLPNEGESKSGF